MTIDPVFFAQRSMFNFHFSLFEMAALPFPCNGLLLCCVNLSKVFLMFFNKFASCSFPYFIIFFYCRRPSFGLNQFRIVQLYKLLKTAIFCNVIIACLSSSEPKKQTFFKVTWHIFMTKPLIVV